MKTIIVLLWTATLTWIKDQLQAFWDAYVKEKQAAKVDDDNVAEAVADVRKPLDPTKSVEEREKDAEDAFDRFRDRLK